MSSVVATSTVLLLVVLFCESMLSSTLFAILTELFAVLFAVVEDGESVLKAFSTLPAPICCVLLVLTDGLSRELELILDVNGELSVALVEAVSKELDKTVDCCDVASENVLLESSSENELDTDKSNCPLEAEVTELSSALVF